MCKTKNCAPSIPKNDENFSPANRTKRLEKSSVKFLPVAKNTKNSSSKSNINDDFCPICGANLRRSAVICGINYSFKILCKCESDKLEKDQEEQRNREKLHKIEALRSLSLLGERYKNSSFQNTKTGINPSFDKAFNRCQKYCELYEQTVKDGYGIYLFGSKGTGKTHLTACMANFLLLKCVPVLFTSLFEISKAVKSTFNDF